MEEIDPWTAEYPKRPPRVGDKNPNYITGRKELIITKEMWEMCYEFDEALKNEERDVAPSCRLLLEELNSNDAFHKLSAETCAGMMDLLVLAHDWCLSGKCTSFDAKELLVEKQYLYTKRGVAHFELLEKMVPNFIHRCLELSKSGKEDDLDLKRKRFLVEDEKSLSPCPILGNQNMETDLEPPPAALSKKQFLSVNKKKVA